MTVDWGAWRFRMLIGAVRNVIFAVDAMRLPLRPHWHEADGAGEAVRIGHRSAWRVTPEGRPAGWLVILPGIGDRMEYWRGVQAMLAANGMGSVVFHYSGYPGSGGRTTPKELEEDGRAVYAWLVAEVREPVFLLGFSLGSGIAATIAGRLQPAPAGLILCSGYTSLRAAAHRLIWARTMTRLLPDIWKTTEALRGLQIEVLVVHSAADWLFPIAMAEEAAQGHRLVRVEGWSHNAAHAEVPEPYWEPILEFVQRKQPNLLTGAVPFDNL